MATIRLRALVDMSLRRSPDQFLEDGEPNPLWDEWFDWAAGEVFEAPAHLKVDLALKRGIAEEVTAKKKKEGADG